MKALGTGLRGVAFRESGRHARSRRSAAPRPLRSGRRGARALGAGAAHVTITHTREMAAAVVPPARNGRIESGAREPPPGPLAGRKILIVDDEPYILKIVSFKLRLSGMIPFEATSGEEALRILREEQPALLLLDVSLTPGLSGFDLCRILKENPATSRLRS